MSSSHRGKNGKGGRRGKSGKRRKKSSKKTSLERFAEQKNQASSDEALGVDFFFLMMGMVTTLMTFLLVGSLFTTAPNTNRALIAAKTGNPVKEVNATDDDEFDELLESSDAVQLSNILKGLNGWKSDKGNTESVKSNQRRIEVANTMLTKKLNPEQRTLAITSKLKALTTVYGFGLLLKEQVPNVAESLRDTSNLYLESPEYEIQKLARLSLFKVNAFEMTKEGNEPVVDLLVNDMCKLLKSFPEDETVLATADMIVEYYRQNVDRVLASKVTDALAERKGEFADAPKVVQMIKDFSDEALLAEAKYTQLFDNRWVNGERGQLELMKKSMQLAAEPTSGTLLVKTIDAVGHWFEQDDQYEKSAAIYEEILKSVDTYQSPEVAALARKTAQDGIQRAKIVGEEIDLSGFLLNGEGKSAENLKGKVVLVVFWSAYEPKSQEMVVKFSQKGASWKERGIRILAVNIDRTWEISAIHKTTKAASKVSFVFGNPQDNYSNNILKQCPSNVVPRLMLVQKDGHVADINVPADEIETQLDFLVGQVFERSDP